MKFKYLNHTSEAKFQAFGNNLAEAYANSSLALMGLMTNLEKVSQRKERAVRVKASGKESLLYDLLDEMIYIVDVDGLFISGFKNARIEEVGGELLFTATALGDDIENCPQGGDVKAPTYDEMKIEESKDGWMVQAVVDV